MATNRFKEQLAQAGNDDEGEGEGEGTQSEEPAAKPGRRTAGSAATREAPPPRRNAAPRAKAKAEPVDEQELYLSTPGEVPIKIPPGSPLYKRALAVFSALFAE